MPGSGIVAGMTATTHPPLAPLVPPEVDAAVRQAADDLEALADRCTELQRDLLSAAYGPSGPLTEAHAKAVSVACRVSAARLSGEHLAQLARGL
jgi:hypothetical protein